MSRDGSGNYTLPTGNPVVTNTIISSGSWANPTLSDIASALTQSLSRDGQTTPTANLTMGNFRLLNLANGTTRTDAINAGQIQDGGLVTLGSISGTDTITASSSPAITAYTAGQRFQFVAAGANTTTAVTLNINGLGAKNVTKNGNVALAAGDIPSGAMVSVVYDGTQFQMAGLSFGLYIGRQVFQSSGTYTPKAGVRFAVFRIWGGGGAGGGSQATAAGQFSVGAGGGAGANIEHFVSPPTAQTITIGAGGIGSSGAAGGNGGNTSVGALIVANGGQGGGIGVAGTSPLATGGNGGTIGTGGNFVNDAGQAGFCGWGYTTGLNGVSGRGASTTYGAGGPDQVTGNTSGTTGQGFGSGGGGAFNLAGQSARAGGNGAPGMVFVDEYI